MEMLEQQLKAKVECPRTVKEAMNEQQNEEGGKGVGRGRGRAWNSVQITAYKWQLKTKQEQWQNNNTLAIRDITKNMQKAKAKH